MATYGDVTVNVVRLNYNAVGTAYTVPAGRRALVSMQSFTTAGTPIITIGGLTKSLSSDIIYPALTSGSGLDDFFSSGFWLNAGDVISCASGTMNIQAVIQEYSNP
jgi:hypothetical protein